MPEEMKIAACEKCGNETTIFTKTDGVRFTSSVADAFTKGRFDGTKKPP